MDEPKSVATHARHMGVNHAQNRSSGNGRVYRRATCAKYIGASGRRQAVGGGDHATRAEGGRTASLHIQNKLLNA